MIRREFLENHGGFNMGLGVSRNKLRYGEEIELQDRIRNHEGTIGYAPSLAIDHFVRPEKLNTGWILHAEYARRRDKMKITPSPFHTVSWKLGLTLIKTGIVLPVRWIMSMVSKKYTMQEAILDSLLPLMYRSGEWWGTLIRKRRKPD
jgi:GT2 family glycosyltransferase